MIEIIAKTSLLLAAGCLLAREVARTRPALAHLLLAASLIGVLAMPLLSSIGPKLQIPILESDLSMAPAKSPLFAGTSVGSWRDHVRGAPRSAFHESSRKSITWEAILTWVWALGATLALVRYLGAWLAIDRLRRLRSYPLEPTDLPVNVRDLAARVGISMNLELRQSVNSELATAMTWGVFRPVVLLPHDADTWSPERFEAVLLHEFAHVRRRDFVNQLLAEVACALYWFNPLVWFSARAMREVAESAADDAVVQSGLKASSYATQLLQLATEIDQCARGQARVGVSAMSHTKIESRLRSVLSPSVRNRGLTSVQALVAVCLASLAITAMAAAALVQGSEKRPVHEQTEAMMRIKKAAIASLIYSADYDDYLPYAQSTESAKSVLMPYIKERESFESPTKGAKFVFNLNLGGVRSMQIAKPAESPLWIERMNGNPSNPAVAFSDGHVAIVNTPEKKEKVEKALKEKYTRDPGMRPLPKNYIWEGF